MGTQEVIDYEGLRLATEEALRDRSRSEVARERYLSPQAVSAACNTHDHRLVKVQIRLIEAYTDKRVTDLGNGRFQIGTNQGVSSSETPSLHRRGGGHRLKEGGGK